MTAQTSGGDNCNFYGLNAAVLLKDGTTTTIRSGIAQSDTDLTTELNLALALENDARVDSTDAWYCVQVGQKEKALQEYSVSS